MTEDEKKQANEMIHDVFFIPDPATSLLADLVGVKKRDFKKDILLSEEVRKEAISIWEKSTK